MASDFLVPDDGPTGHGSRFSSLDGSAAIQVNGLPLGERGDHVPGFICLAHGNTSNNTIIDGFDVYTDALVLVAAITSVITNTTATASASVRAVRPAGPFYVLTARPGASSRVWTIDTAGAVGGITWDLPTIGGFDAQVMGISQDESVIYFADRIHDDGQPMKRWDTVMDTALSDLVTLSIDEKWGFDVLTFADGSLITLVQDTNTFDWEIRHYSSVGALLDSSNIGQAGSYEDPEMTVDIEDAAFFWIRRFTDGSGATTTFTRYALSDLSVSREFVVDTDPTDNGVGITPSSCPIVMLLSSIVVPPEDEQIIGPLAWVHWPRIVPGPLPPDDTGSPGGSP